jgi:hypothetical protein
MLVAYRAPPVLCLQPSAPPRTVLYLQPGIQPFLSLQSGIWPVPGQYFPAVLQTVRYLATLGTEWMACPILAAWCTDSFVLAAFCTDSPMLAVLFTDSPILATRVYGLPYSIQYFQPVLQTIRYLATLRTGWMACPIQPGVHTVLCLPSGVQTVIYFQPGVQTVLCLQPAVCSTNENVCVSLGHK